MIKDFIYKKICEYLSKSNNNKILISISGGVDSVVLTHLVNFHKNKLNLKIYLFHVNYETNDNSKKSDDLCKNISKRYKNIYKSILCDKIDNNFEHKARHYRYKKIYQYASDNNINIILTAHHLDDQIETVYMKEINNSDWISKVGIRPEIDKVKRPLLNLRKINLLKYAQQNKILWIEDLTNTNKKYLRNKIRLNVIPKLKESNKNFEKNLLKLNKQCLMRYEKLIYDINQNYCKYIIKKNTNYLEINNSIINKYTWNELKLFYQIINKKFFNVHPIATSRHWKKFYIFLTKEKSGKMFIINTKLSVLNNRKSHFIIYDNYLQKIRNNRLETKIQLDVYPFKFFNSLIIKNKNSFVKSDSIPIRLSKKMLRKGVFVRNWRKGDTCYSNYYKKYIKVKNIFINNKISLIDKYDIPLFIDSKDDIICIPNLYNRYDCIDNYQDLYWIKQ